MITRVNYGGWANNIKISNGLIELIATLDVGPRIIRFGFAGGQNMFKEVPDELGKANESEFKLRGGHRFWLAPEILSRTYYPDNAPVAVEELDEFTIRLSPPPETDNGVQKELDVRMSSDDNEVTVTHRIFNIGSCDLCDAPWALTVFDAGGKAIIPLPEQQRHSENFIPQASVVLWPSTDMSDSRIHWGRRYITFTQDRSQGPTKFGLMQPLGWAAYLLNTQLFIKYFDYFPTETYTDLGCNFETYSDEGILELETLGPLATLAPGETAEHVETWRLFAGVPEITDETSVDLNIIPLI